MEWEFVDHVDEAAAKADALKRKLEEYDSPHYIISKYNLARLIEDFCHGAGEDQAE